MRCWPCSIRTGRGSEMDDLRAELEKLAKRWKGIIDEGFGPTDRIVGIENCWHELDALLARHPEPAAPSEHVAPSEREKRLEDTLRSGCQRMNDLLLEHERGREKNRPFIIACRKWLESARAALSGEQAKEA
jgi:hypothetical protein